MTEPRKPRPPADTPDRDVRVVKVSPISPSRRAPYQNVQPISNPDEHEPESWEGLRTGVESRSDHESPLAIAVRRTGETKNMVADLMATIKILTESNEKQGEVITDLLKAQDKREQERRDDSRLIRMQEHQSKTKMSELRATTELSDKVSWSNTWRGGVAKTIAVLLTTIGTMTAGYMIAKHTEPPADHSRPAGDR